MFRVQFKKEYGMDSTLVKCDQWRKDKDFIYFENYDAEGDIVTQISMYSKDVIFSITKV